MRFDVNDDATITMRIIKGIGIRNWRFIHSWSRIKIQRCSINTEFLDSSFEGATIPAFSIRCAKARHSKIGANKRAKRSNKGRRSTSL
jgi:hypothetical protein